MKSLRFLFFFIWVDERDYLVDFWAVDRPRFLWYVTMSDFKICFMLRQVSPARHVPLKWRPSMQIAFLCAPRKNHSNLLTVVVLRSTFAELWQAQACWFKWILLKRDTSSLTPVCISIPTQWKGSCYFHAEHAEEGPTLLLLIEEGEANSL